MISKISQIYKKQPPIKKIMEIAHLQRAFAKSLWDWILLKYLKELLNKIDLSLPSLTHQLPKIKNFNGIGVVEASRGSLIHKISLRNSKIIDYEIITPTQSAISQMEIIEREV